MPRKITNIRALKKKLWRIFAEYIRLRDKDKPCISCGKRTKLQAGHLFPRSVTYNSLYFDEFNVNGQCAHCNCFLEGNTIAYRDGFIKRYGEKAMETLMIKKELVSKWGYWEFEALIKYYKDKIKEFE